MSKSFITEYPKYTFTDANPTTLVGKESLPVEIVDADAQTIQQLNAGIYIGTIYERLEGSNGYLVHTRGPIRKCIAAAAINAPAYVKQSANGLQPANSGDKCCGIAISPKTIAQGDVVSFIQTDCVMP